MDVSLSKTLKLEGVSLVAGYAKGEAVVLKPLSDYEIERTNTPQTEQKKFRNAVKTLEKEFTKNLKKKISEDQKSLLEISKMLLLDRGWNQKIEEIILKGYTAVTALHQVTEDITTQMSKLDDIIDRFGLKLSPPP